MQALVSFGDQGVFLRSRQMFDMIFQFHRAAPVAFPLGPHERDGTSGSGVFGCGRAMVMLPESLVQIVGHAGIEGIVSASEDVGVSHESGSE